MKLDKIFKIKDRRKLKKELKKFYEENGIRPGIRVNHKEEIERLLNENS